MSRLGKLSIPLPASVKVSLIDHTVHVEGPKGKLEQKLPIGVKVIVDDAVKQVRVEREDDRRQSRASHGTARKLVLNMVIGVTEGYTRVMEVVGTGFSAKLQGKELVLQVGFTNAVKVTIPEGIKIDPPVATSMYVAGPGNMPCVVLTLHSMDKQLIGEFAAEVRRIRPPEPYKTKGIRYQGEVIRRKTGKTFASAE